MSKILACPHGHRWDSGDGTSPQDGEALCPVCTPVTVRLSSSKPPDATSYLWQTPAPPQRTPAWPHIAGYEILGVLGRGGMGVVYQARQMSLKRVVALKMLRPGETRPEALLRFRAEAEVVARLQHPNIVQVYEVGEHEGCPFFSLEFVDGGTLQEKLKGTPQPPRVAARAVAILARAMHAAHARGIVHRDLKPTNVLLSRKSVGIRKKSEVGSRKSEVGSRKEEVESNSEFRIPNSDLALIADFELKITDFGVAKQVDSGPGLTQSETVMGTPSYMAPEQARGLSKEVGPAADVYALGAVLYEMLTGRPPFQAESSMATALQVIENDPVPPTRLQPAVPLDLETICLKCLQKRPARRYLTAEKLAEDLRRFVAGEPIEARPVGNFERGIKWARRHPAAAGLLGVGAAAVAVVLLILLVANGKLQRERDRAVREERAASESRAVAEERAGEAQRQTEIARRSLYALQLGQAAGVRERDRGMALELLADTRHCPFDLRDLSWGLLNTRCDGRAPSVKQFPAGVTAVAFAPGGVELAVAGGPPDGPAEVYLWDPATGKARGILRGHPAAVTVLAFAPDGATLAAAGADGAVKIWDWPAGKERLTLAGQRGPVNAIAYAPDGRTLATGGEDWTARLWDPRTGTERATLKGHAGGVRAVAFAPDGRVLATGSADTTVKLWDTAAGTERATLQGHAGGVAALAFAPSGDTLAVATGNPVQGNLAGTVPAGGQAGKVRLWNVVAGRLQGILPGHLGGVHALVFTPDGRALVTGGADRCVRVWDPRTGQERACLAEHQGEVSSLAVASDGATLAAGATDGRVILWHTAVAKVPATFRGHAGEVASVAFAPDARTMATASADATVKLWDMASGQERATLEGHTGWVLSLAFSPDGQVVASGDACGVVKLWEAVTGKERATLAGHKDAVRALAFAPDGRTLATASQDGAVKLWDVGSAEVRLGLKGHAGGVWAVTFSRDGQTLAVGCGLPNAGEVRLWDTAKRQPRATLRGRMGTVTALAFTSDGSELITGSKDRVVTRWRLATGTAEYTLPGYRLEALSRDGGMLAVAGPNHTVKLVDAATGREQATFNGHQDVVTGVAFTADGTLLATASWDQTVRLWATGRPHAAER